MSFSENLQNLRKSKEMSQEQLSEKLNVSRQAVSKWESGNGYPETEKILILCEMFDCSMDTIMRGKISEDNTSDRNNYDSFKNKFSKGIALGVGGILLGTTIFISLSQGSENLQTLGLIILLCFVAISVPLFICLGMENDTFIKKNPKMPYIYKEEEVEKFNKKFSIATAAGVSLILIGTIILILLYGMNIVSDKSTIPITILLSFVTIAVTIFVYFGIQKEKFDIDGYNKTKTCVENEKVNKICGCIMLTGTAIFLGAGFLFNLWKYSWVVFPIGGILCGIVSIIFKDDNMV